MTKQKKRVALSLAPETVRRIRTAKGWMLSDPNEMNSRDSRSSAVDYALRHLLANPPEHVRAHRMAAGVDEG